MAALEAARERGDARITLIGASDLAGIAEFVRSTAALTAVVDANVAVARFADAPVRQNIDSLRPYPKQYGPPTGRQPLPRCGWPRQKLGPKLRPGARPPGRAAGRRAE
jgi:hypothetical protein